MDNNAASIPRNPSKAPTRMDTVCFSQPGFWGNIGLIRTIVMASEDATLGRVAFISRSTHSISCGPYISVRSCTNRGYKEFRTCRTDGTRNPHPILSNTNRAPPCDACNIVADVKAVRLAPRAEVPSITDHFHVAARVCCRSGGLVAIRFAPHFFFHSCAQDIAEQSTC